VLVTGIRTDLAGPGRPTPWPRSRTPLGYGGVLGLLFLHDSLEDRAEQVKELNPDGTLKHLPPPSMTGVAGFMTENGSWGDGLAHLGVFKEDRIRYCMVK
jgi:hypothetical protein